VHRLICSWHLAAGHLAVFQGGPSRTGGRSAHLSHTGRASPGGRRTEKQPTGRGPEGCVEKWAGGCPATAGSVTYRFRYAPLAPFRLGPPCRRPILNATRCQLYMRQCTNQQPSVATFQDHQFLSRIIKFIFFKLSSRFPCDKVCRCRWRHTERAFCTLVSHRGSFSAKIIVLRNSSIL
jgi:hypothetical protein